MPLSNLRFMLVVVIFSLVCISRMSIREQIFFNAWHKIRQTAFVQPTEQDLFEGALEGMTAKLRNKYGDQYSAFENATQQQISRDHIENQLVGLGVSLVPPGKSRGVLLYPLPNSPALQAGVQHGDFLLQIEGNDVAELTPGAISKKLEGNAGTKVTLLVRRTDSERETEIDIEVTVTRARMHLPSVLGDHINPDGSWCYTLETAPDIGYLALNRTFSDSTPFEVKRALEELKKSQDLKGVILDLRGNPGGYLNAAVGVCNLFLNEGVIVTTKQRNFSDSITAPGTAIWDKPVVVLIDAMSASAAEIVAACLQDHGIAVVVGTRSYGKGTVQQMTTLPLNLGTVRLTKAEYFRPSEKNINRGNKDEDDEWGVTPNDGYTLELSERQAAMTFQIRNLRAIVPGDELRRQIDFLVECVKTGEHESSDMNSELCTLNFELSGAVPYYDPQLDLAVQYLSETQS